MHISLEAIVNDYKEWRRKKAAMIGAIERYTEERMNDENTDGSRSGGQPTQADRAAMESILWVETIIDDQEAIAKAFACHRDYGYDRGYYDGCAHTMGAWNRRDDVLREALEAAPIINLWESKEDFRRRQDGWLKTKYRAALERSK